MQEQKKVKDMQPPFQSEREFETSEASQTNRQGWNSEKVAAEASGKDADEIQREMKRGGASGEAADERDIAGSVESNDTPQGREEAKKDVGGKANENG